MKKYLLPMLLGLTSTTVFAMGEDDPLLTMVMIDQLEYRDADGVNPWVLEADAWVGKDLNKLWFKTEIERVGGENEEAQLEMLYSRAIDPYWDFQVGVRHDFEPSPERNWAVAAFHGLAPYYFEVDASLYLGESGRTAASLQAEYEFMFTQKLVLSPEIELNLYGKDDPELGIGSGLSDMQAGLRLRYEIRREFAPYIGVNWVKKFGDTADYASDEGESDDDLQLVVGVRAWF